MLIQRDLPPSTGYKSMTINQGSLRNNGLEVSLHGDIIRTKDFTWSLSGNIAFNRPEILDFGLPEEEWGTGQNWKAYMGNSLGDHFGEANIFIAGKAPGLFYGYQTDGIIQENDPYIKQIDATKSIGTVKAGNLKFVDQNGDGAINEKIGSFWEIRIRTLLMDSRLISDGKTYHFLWHLPVYRGMIF